MSLLPDPIAWLVPSANRMVSVEPSVTYRQALVSLVVFASLWEIGARFTAAYLIPEWATIVASLAHLTRFSLFQVSSSYAGVEGIVFRRFVFYLIFFIICSHFLVSLARYRSKTTMVGAYSGETGHRIRRKPAGFVRNTQGG